MELNRTVLEAEKYVLGSMMVKSSIVPEIAGIIEPGDFIEPKHDLIARAIIGLQKNGNPTDPIAVSDALVANGELQRAGGVEYLHDLHGYPSTWANAGYYAEIVHEEGRRRAMLVAGEQIVLMAQDRSNSPDAIFEGGRAALTKASGARMTEGEASISVLASAVEGIGKSVVAYPTPWPSLTSKMRGFRPGGLYIIGARPGIGKSALALQCASGLQRHGTIAFFTLEMAKEEVALRLIAQETQVAYSMLTGDTTLPDWAQHRVDEWLGSHDGNIMFYDRGTVTMGHLRSTIHALAMKGQLAGVVVDYLQLMTGDPRLSKVAQVTEISRELKLIARDYNIPVIALSQLNRNSEGRADKRPALADLRESGSIEQDADVVMLLHRDMQDAEGDIDLILAKNRQGPTGTVTLGWQGEFVRAVA